MPVQVENSEYAGPYHEAHPHSIREGQEHSMQHLAGFVKIKRAVAKVLNACHVSISQILSHVEEIIYTHEDVQNATKA